MRGVLQPSRRGSLALLMTLAGLAVAAGAGCSDAKTTAAAAQPASLTVQRSTLRRSIPAGFLGLSMEYRGLAAYLGTNPKQLNPVFEQLLRNLSAGASPVLRVGGDSSDWTWVPVRGIAQPPGVKYSLTRGYFAAAKSLVQATGTKLILGLNLEANNAGLATGEMNAMNDGIGKSAITAFEIGNEPELYGSFSWYKAANGTHVTGRPAGYGFNGFLSDFSRFAQQTPAGPLAGPSAGGPAITSQLGRFLSSERRVQIATLHSYPLKHCRATSQVTIGQLLANGSQSGLANGLAHFVGIAHGHHVPLRIDEINAVSCGGQRGVSDVFASALWAANTLFELARVGVDGVNFHTVPKTINELFSATQLGSRWHSYVHPQYYGMMLFAQAAPAGSALLRVTGRTGTGLHVWATQGTDNKTRVTLINESAGKRTTTLRLTSSSGNGRLELLRAPSLTSKTGLTLGGQGFGPDTTTGQLAGKPAVTTVTPDSGGTYSITVPGNSAALLTVG